MHCVVGYAVGSVGLGQLCGRGVGCGACYLVTCVRGVTRYGDAK